MAIDAIVVTTLNHSLGAQVVNVANQLRGVKTGINDMANIMSHMNDGTNFALIEQQLGLATGDGSRLQALIATLQTQINGSTAVADFSTKVINGS